MSAVKVEIRPGSYFDSVILMQLQQSLSQLANVIEVGVVMGTEANKELLSQTGLLPEEAKVAKNDDLLVVVKAENETIASDAIAQIDTLLQKRKSSVSEDYRPRSLEAAQQMAPDANWVLISVPGRYAAGVAHQALDIGKNVFLYSDNVSIEDEIKLKQKAEQKNLIVMGPDCGTAIVNSAGLGFANAVRKGNIGLVGASGTGLQAVTVAIHHLEAGITHALGTGGRDLSKEVQAITACQSLKLLAQDSETQVIVLISKPPAAEVAQKVLATAKAGGKPTVVHFIGYPAKNNEDNLYYADSLEQTARIAVELSQKAPATEAENTETQKLSPKQKYLRALYSGGTLAYETLLQLKDTFPMHSNIKLPNSLKLENAQKSQKHTIVDLGEDEYTVGRLHPMMDNDLRIKRLRQEANDPETAIILLDIVLGHGAHPDPASEIAPVIQEILTKQNPPQIIAAVIGTNEDPQNAEQQIQKLKEAGATVTTSNTQAIHHTRQILNSLVPKTTSLQPVKAINVGLELFSKSLKTQEIETIQVDWQPPAGGNEKLMSILERMKSKK